MVSPDNLLIYEWERLAPPPGDAATEDALRRGERMEKAIRELQDDRGDLENLSLRHLPEALQRAWEKLRGELLDYYDAEQQHRIRLLAQLKTELAGMGVVL